MESKATSETPAVEQTETCAECPVKVWTSALRDFEDGFKGLVPTEFWQHRRAAKREALLAVRSLLDTAILHLESEPPKRVRRAATKVAVK
jgi:hypothetical protein